MAIVWIVIGLGVLLIGAEMLVRGAASLARAVGMPPLIIGLTVVAFGTSAPELAVSVKAALNDQANIALGNVLGSNICNVLLILGISAAIAPLAVSAQLVRLDVPVMIVVSALTWAMAWDGVIARMEGTLLLLIFGGYTVVLIYAGMRCKPAEDCAEGDIEEAIGPVPARLGTSVVLVLIGLGLLVLGANWLVDGAVSLARTLGVSELVIGLTIVALGTSMPEVATSIMASIRGQRDIAVGNVVGSNLFNLLVVLGGSAVAARQGIPVIGEALRFDLPVMVAVALACLPIFVTGGRISRLEGVLFLGYYAAYVVFLVFAAMRHWALGTFTSAMIWFVLPLTILGITVSLWDWLRRCATKSVTD